MKKILSTLVLSLVATVMLLAQAPQTFSYQTVVRDNNWQVIQNQSIGVQVSIIEDVANGIVVYQEEHTATTNDIGLINLAVGGGTLATGLFSSIDWGNHSYFMKISVDVSGGTNYVAMGTTQLRSVPYALFAETSNNAGPQGIQGVAGNDGVDGVDGIDGTNGLDGIDGVDGLAGAQGIQGLQGDTGVAGVQGSIGLTGAQGIQGLQGDTGIAGTNGVNGIDGTNGVDGADGTNGVDGLNGTNGAVGATGTQGIQGVAGNDGADGTNGIDGTNGVDGAVGATGTQGIQGVAGNDGADGADGVDGIDGVDGQGGITNAGTGISVTGAGTSVSPYVVSTSTCGLSIGDTTQGGIIFYLDPSGCHGLVCALTDQSSGTAWYNGSYMDIRAYGSGLFEGKYNTKMINWEQGGSTSAAAICAAYTGGFFNDWYLPSIEELNKMYLNIGQGNALGLGNIAGFANDYYWSSTECDDELAWRQNFNIGNQFYSSKMYNSNVRAVRAF